MRARMYLSRRWLLAATCLQAGVTLSGAQASQVYPHNTLRVRIRGFTVTRAVVGMPLEGSFTAIHERAERLSGTIYLGILHEDFGFETFDLIAVEVPTSSPALVKFQNGPIPESAGRKWLEFRSENSDRVSFQVRRK